MSDILIDVSRLVGRRLKRRLPTGIDRVGQAYLRRYGERSRAAFSVGSRAVVLPRRASQRLFEHLLSPSDERAFLRTLVAGAMHAPLPYASRPEDSAGAWFLNTGHTGLHRPGYATMLAAMRVRPLFVVHDLIPITHPQYCRVPERARHAARMTTVLRSAAALVCNSTATFESLARFGLSIGTALPPAAVATLAAEPLDPASVELARRTVPLPTPYFVMLGTIEPRKNHLMILQVWQRLIERLGADAPKLVLIGQAGWECEHVQRVLERTPGIRDHVLVHDGCTDQDLLGWMVHARALLFPSFVEGFGLPVVEALRLGVPVLAADAQVYREFAGEYPEYLDPLDAAGWLNAILDYRQAGHRRRERRVEALARYRQPTWDEHFARVDDLMTRVDRHAARRAIDERAGAGAAVRASHA